MFNHNDVQLSLTPKQRRAKARKLRERAFEVSNPKNPERHENNGEERAYIRTYGFPLASFSKGLPHNSRGEVDLDAYKLLLRALRSGRERDFARIPLGSADPHRRRLVHPQAGLGFDLEGPDAQALTIPPAPRITDRKNDAEMLELYWMALLRDVSFTDYAQSLDVAAAARELDKYRGELDMPLAPAINARTLFRGFSEGALKGPYLSQFLLEDFFFAPLPVRQRQFSAKAGLDFLTNFEDWLSSQQGAPEPAGDVFEFDKPPRYIRNLRDLAAYVHVDAPFIPYLGAALILGRLAVGNGALLAALQDEGNPYLTRTPNQEGFAAFGPPALLGMMAEVTTRAAKGMWFQKWFVHRRLRPEEYGGRVDVHRRDLAHYRVSQELLDSEAHQRTLSRFGSSLLPQAYAEGCPLHPAYGAGHAASAGACTTILKAFLNERHPWPVAPKVPSADGTTLVNYTGPDAGELTVGGELDKLAANIALGRSAAGVHWRTDYTQALQYGERVALAVLAEHSLLINETHHYTVETFDGRTVRIEDGCIKEVTPREAPLLQASAAAL
jgi:hypothetical protein